jgi:hypothetical protein
MCAKFKQHGFRRDEYARILDSFDASSRCRRVGSLGMLLASVGSVREGLAASRSCQRVRMTNYTMRKHVPALWSPISISYKSSNIASVISSTPPYSSSASSLSRCRRCQKYPEKSLMELTVDFSRNHCLSNPSRLGGLSRTAPWLVPRLSRLVFRALRTATLLFLR